MEESFFFFPDSPELSLQSARGCPAAAGPWELLGQLRGSPDGWESFAMGRLRVQCSSEGHGYSGGEAWGNSSYFTMYFSKWVISAFSSLDWMMFVPSTGLLSTPFILPLYECILVLCSTRSYLIRLCDSSSYQCTAELPTNWTLMNTLMRTDPTNSFLISISYAPYHPSFQCTGTRKNGLTFPIPFVTNYTSLDDFSTTLESD